MFKTFLLTLASLLMTTGIVSAGSQTYSTPGTYSFTVPSYGSLTVSVWGGGGGGAKGIGVSGLEGGASSFNGTVVGNGGAGGIFSLGGGTGGAGGTASGGDTNTTGTAGQAGTPACGGAGGAAPNGGAGGAGDCTADFSDAGFPGVAPGGGGGGDNYCFWTSCAGSGGGGGGGYATKTYASGSLAPGSSVTVVVGVAGIGSTAYGGAPHGAAGMVEITWTPALPAAPSTPTFSNITGTTLRLSWDAVTDADTYRVRRCAGSGCTAFVQIATNLTSLYYDDTGLTPGTTYRYQVMAVNVTGAGPWSVAGTPSTSPLPTCTLAASPDTGMAGQSATLTWTSTNADSVSINQGIGSVAPAAGGSRMVTPSVTTTYTGTFTGIGGTTQCQATVTVSSCASGENNGDMNGWAWSDTIGWISMNSGDAGTCTPSTYGVTVATDGTLSGYAWSENIGWIKFGGLSSFPTGAGTVAQNAQFSGNAVLGWVRACAGTVSGDCSSMTSRTDGWDGWISLSGTGYGLSYANGEFDACGTGPNPTSCAWGDVNVGWVDFRHVTTSYEACSGLPANFCDPAGLYGVSKHRNASCIVDSVTNCPWQCDAGTGLCISPPVPTGDLSGPLAIRQNSTSTVTWTVQDAQSCTATGSDGTIITSSGEVITLTQNTTFTLVCTDAAGSPHTIDTLYIRVLPVWQEL